MIYVESKRKSMLNLQKQHPNALIIDVTSRGEEPWVQVSPFYPHGGIPIPYTEGFYAASVEGVWQGLKVFEGEDVDISKFENCSMKGLKRTVRRLGKPLGHRKGLHGTELLDYATARKKIYLVTYGWMLEHKAGHIITRIVAQAEKQDIVLLDFDTNGDIDNLKSPLSHAALVKRFIEKKHPHLASGSNILNVAVTVHQVKAKSPKTTISKVGAAPKTAKSRKSIERKPKASPNQLSFL